MKFQLGDIVEGRGEGEFATTYTPSQGEAVVIAANNGTAMRIRYLNGSRAGDTIAVFCAGFELVNQNKGPDKIEAMFA